MLRGRRPNFPSTWELSWGQRMHCFLHLPSGLDRQQMKSEVSEDLLLWRLMQGTRDCQEAVASVEPKACPFRGGGGSAGWTQRPEAH